MNTAAADQALADGVRRGERRALARAITLLESTRGEDRPRADALLNALLPAAGRALRLGISGVPGAGKSTFIEALGLQLIGRGHRVAVLAVDPSSSLSGGSILGDKTRMERLAQQDAAFIRPSPAGGTLGGVGGRTREALLACEAAGFDVVLVETVGIGQNETTVAGMTDLFLLLQLPNAGDELQAIKRGVMELADLVVVNKADLDAAAATRACATLASALGSFAAHSHGGPPPALAVSALRGDGISQLWSEVERIAGERRASGAFDARRRQQSLAWLWDTVRAALLDDFHAHPAVQAALPALLADVSAARIAPPAAARVLLDRFER